MFKNIIKNEIDKFNFSNCSFKKLKNRERVIKKRKTFDKLIDIAGNILHMI